MSSRGQRALSEAGLAIEGWKIHRRIGMSGGLFTRAVTRETGRPLSAAAAGRDRRPDEAAELYEVGECPRDIKPVSGRARSRCEV